MIGMERIHPLMCPNEAITFRIDAPVNARYVKFDIADNHGAVNVGVSEVMFGGTTVCPE